MTKANHHMCTKVWVMASNACLWVLFLECYRFTKEDRKFHGCKIISAGIINDIDIVARCLVFPEKNFVFQQNLVPVHWALSNCNYFKSKNIQLLYWPGNSPDVKSIESMWAYLKRQWTKFHAIPKNNYGKHFSIIGTLWIKSLVKIS